MERGRVILEDIEFQVKSLNKKKKQVDTIEPLLQVTIGDAEKNILNILNDDCLWLIFGKIKHFSDIYSIANVCKRFRKIAKHTFASNFKQEAINLIDLIPKNQVTLFQIEDFLREFGSLISWVQIDKQCYKNLSNSSNTILKMINKYCKNLKKLSLIASSVETDTITETIPLFQQLKYLHIDLPSSEFNNFKHCLMYCTQLETLHIFGFVTSVSSLPMVKLPKLTVFWLTNPGISCDKFLTYNPQIQELDVVYSMEICKLIAEKMPNIRKLALDCYNTYFLGIDADNLKYLKYLDIHMRINTNIENIFPMKNITTMIFVINHNTFFSDMLLLELARNMPNLKMLGIEICESEFSVSNQITTSLLKQMLQHANQLSELIIYWPYGYIHQFNETDYNEILEVVEKRTNEIELRIEMVCRQRDPQYYIIRKDKFLRLCRNPKLNVERIYRYRTVRPVFKIVRRA